MESYNFTQSSQLEALKALVAEGKKLGFDVGENLEKLTRIIDSLQQDKELRIVLLGSISDGKTSAIAGLFGKILDNMKIDSDESSDELCFYQPIEGVKIIDTPGLFGTKEKEVDGKNVKFSHITENYISESHIIIYVCGSVVPLKESHSAIISKVMRDYNKLDNTIFVINKMDEAGYDLTDDEDFERGKEIKKQNLIKRLRETINLTPEEEKRLNIVCIAANPDEEGLTYWFEQMEEYYKASRIQDLRKKIDDISSHSDVSQLQEEAVKNSVNELLGNIGETIEETNIPMQKALRKVEQQMPDLQDDLKQLRSELALSRNELCEMLLSIKDNTLSNIDGASFETIHSVIDRHLGIEGKKVTFYVLKSKINMQVERCCETNAQAIGDKTVHIDNTYNMQEKMIEDALGRSSAFLKNVNISGEQVKAVRNIVAKGYKFKPWGAIKLGKNISKGLGYVGTAIGAAIEIHKWYKAHKNAKELSDLKNLLKKAVNEYFSQLLTSFTNEDEYYKNYAPSYIELCQTIQQRNTEIEQMKQRVKELETYKLRIDKWRQSGEYVDFEEV